MKLTSISFNDKTARDYQPAGIFPPNINRAPGNSSASPHTTVILKDQPGQVANTLAQEIRNPLGHIKLSVEMLSSIIEDNDLKMYLEVIMRNSIRIDNLVQEFLLESRP